MVVEIGKKEEEKEEAKEIKMTITMVPGGGIAVKAPGDGKFFNSMVCNHMLIQAYEYMNHSNRQASKSKIVKAGGGNGGIIDFVRGGKRKK